MNFCPYCVKAKALLTQRGVPFEEVNTDPWPDSEWDALVKRSRMKTLPQIFFGEQLIGGYTELAAQDAKDNLKSLGAS